MKHLVFLLALTFVLSSCSNCAKEGDSLRVLSWNIWHEGHSNEFGKQACDGVIGVLKKSKADVVLMVETYGASDKVADSLQYYHRLLSNNLSIYSRYPIVKTYTFPDRIPTFNFGGVEILVNGKKVRIFDTWLHYLPDARCVPTEKSEAEILAWDDAGSRDDEIRIILDILKPFMAESDSIPIIMGGDFNIHSHLDWTEATKDLYNHGGAVVNWTVSKSMEKAGFIDSFRKINPDPVKNIGTTWLTAADSVATPNRQDRIDYIYYHGKTINAESSQCYDNILGEQFSFEGDKFFYGSDHGFVLTDFSIK